MSINKKMTQKKEKTPEILIHEVLKHFANTEVLEGIILDWQHLDERPILEFINFLLENTNLVEDVDKPKFIEAIRNIARKYGITHLIPSLNTENNYIHNVKVRDNSSKKKIIIPKVKIRDVSPKVRTKISDVKVLDRSPKVSCLSILDNAFVRVLQISDLHIGKFHCCQNEKETMRPENALIIALKNLKEEQKPHFCVFSGDLTSVAASEEFKEASDFLVRFIEEDKILCNVKGIPSSYRVLVVPGNHDNKWHSQNLGNDHLSSFRKYFIERGNFLSPFGRPVNLKKNKCLIYFDNSSLVDKLAPFSLISFPSLNINFGLLTSCYNSGEIVGVNMKTELANIKKLFFRRYRNSDDVISSLRKIILLDKGYFSAEYIDSITDVINKAKSSLGDKYQKSINMAITHHPVISCGKVPPCHGALALRLNLKSWGFSTIFHGHAHAVNLQPDRSNPSRASGIPCPSISALDRDDSLGVLINCISKSKSTIDSILWRYNPEGAFTLTEDYLTHLNTYTV
jgi:hypothetical protein